MKFYFCEKCGKRVTDDDLEHGSARDKKLRGVFCKECAEGVLTMNELPLSNEEARALLEKEKPKRPSEVKRVPKVSSKSRRKTSASETLEASESQRTQPQSIPMVFYAGGGVAAALLCAVIAYLLLADADPPRSTAKAPVKHVEPVEPAIPAAEQIPTPTTPSEVSETTQSAHAEKAEVPAVEKAAESGHPVAPTPNEQIEPAEAKKTSPADSSSSAVKKPEPTADPKAPPSVEKPVPGKKTAEAPKSEISEADKKKEAEKAYVEFDSRFRSRLQALDLEGAEAALNEAMGSKAAAWVRERFDADAHLLAWTRKLEQHALNQLKAMGSSGVPFSLKTRKGRALRVGGQTGLKITDVRDGVIHYGDKRMTLKLPLTDVSEDTWFELNRRNLPMDGQGRLLYALSQLLRPEQGVFEKALLDRALKAGAKEPLVAVLREKNDRFGWGKASRQETAVRLMQSFEDHMAGKRWKDAADVGRKLLDGFADVGVVRERSDLKERVGEAAKYARTRGGRFGKSKRPVYGGVWRPFKVHGDRPPSREHAYSHLTYDPKRRRVILWGGENRNDLWALDLKLLTWTCLEKNNQSTSFKGPGERSHGKLDYDPLNDRYIVSPGWAYLPDKRKWEPIPKNPAFPGTRSGWALDTDAMRFLSFKPPFQYFFDLSTQKSIKTKRPTIGSRYVDRQLAYDPVQKLFVMFGGGRYEASTLSDTCVFDPETQKWTVRKPDPHPTGRSCTYLVWCDHLQKLLLVGGHGTDTRNAWVYDTGENLWTKVRVPKWPVSAGAGAYIPDAKLFLTYHLRRGETWVLDVRRLK